MQLSAEFLIPITAIFLEHTHTRLPVPLISDKVSQTEKMLSFVVCKCTGQAPIFISEALKRNWQFSENGRVEEMFTPKSAQSASSTGPDCCFDGQSQWKHWMSSTNHLKCSNNVIFVCWWVCVTKTRSGLCIWIGCIYMQIVEMELFDISDLNKLQWSANITAESQQGSSWNLKLYNTEFQNPLHMAFPFHTIMP